MKNIMLCAWLLILLLPACKKTIQTSTVTISDKDSTLPMELSYWEYFSEKEKTFKMPQTGRYVKTSEGLQVFAADSRAGGQAFHPF